MKKLFFLFMIFIQGCSSVNYRISEYNPYNFYHGDTRGTLTEKEKSDIILFGLGLLDTKYHWGGKKPYFGIDCSGLVTYVFEKSVNISMKGAARDIVKNGKPIPISFVKQGKLEPGDLIFFNTTGRSFSHVGIYIGNSKFLHASSGRGKVITTSIFKEYYLKRIEAIKRI